MTNLHKAAEMALGALDIYREHDPENIGIADAAYEALRQALAQPEQEPVAWLDSDGFPWSKEGVECRTTQDTYTPLYTAPPKREWVGLTDEEIDGIYKTHHDQYGKCQTGGFEYERTIEAKLKEKNT